MAEHTASEKDANQNGSRLREIRDILIRNKVQRGVSPQKLRIILEELGPTFIKLGQIMSLHSDILPKAYCDELMKLNSDVTPMPFETVEDVISHSLGEHWSAFFKDIDPKPLGSASIAQVHRATLKTGEDVIVKVQRKNIYDTMSRDISLLHRLVKLMPPIGDLKSAVDLNMVLDEMWAVAQEEMDFLKEARNMEEFAHNNRDVKYVRVPKLYKEFCTSRVLTMEYIGGLSINDKEGLLKEGYDLNEIGTKFVNSFIKQVMDDGFFHADPHPGNVKIEDGKIVWIDMGMMGRLSEPDRKIMYRGVKGIALHDVTMVENAVLDLGDFYGKPDRSQLYMDLKQFLQTWGNSGMGSVSIADAMNDLLEIMKKNQISMPHGMTMLCRGLAHMEGVLSTISPDISMFEIAANRMSDDMFSDIDWKKEIRKNSRGLYRMVRKGAEIPGLTADILKEYLAGQSNFNISLHSSETFNEVVASAVRNLVIGLCVAALLVASAIISTTRMKPLVWDMPLLGLAGYAFALAVSTLLVTRYVYHKLKPKMDRRRARREKVRKQMRKKK
jgi:ubiquinone biosynthesis protein